MEGWREGGREEGREGGRVREKVKRSETNGQERRVRCIENGRELEVK